MINESSDLQWLIDSGLKEAELWEPDSRGNTVCGLCPRSCVIKKGSFGFCKSRFNRDGVLYTAIWGKLLTPSIEPIETEAVFHYWPGAKTLSIGNLGCNLKCNFCQNWESSNLEEVFPNAVQYYTPDEIVDLASKLGVKVISFTYNDPAIWFEYVVETAVLARKSGLKTLFKSAGYISQAAIHRLIDVIDVFSISLKSLNPKIFKSMSKGGLNDVLDLLRVIDKSNCHLEISNLLVTGINDSAKEVRHVAKWVKEELSEDIPLHFVRFHPAYKYLNVNRTSLEFLEEAREIAIGEGVKNVYIGNTYIEGHADTYCKKCGVLLVKRFGMSTQVENVSDDGRCLACNTKIDIEFLPSNAQFEVNKESLDCDYISWDWVNDDTQTIHLELDNKSLKNSTICCEHCLDDGKIIHIENYSIPAETSLRIAVFKHAESEKQIRVYAPKEIECKIFELLDRAHFPLLMGD